MTTLIDRDLTVADWCLWCTISSNLNLRYLKSSNLACAWRKSGSIRNFVGFLPVPDGFPLSLTGFHEQIRACQTASKPEVAFWITKHAVTWVTKKINNTCRGPRSALASALALLVLKLEVCLTQLFRAHVHVKVGHLLHEAALLAELFHRFVGHAAAVLPCHGDV